MDGTRGLQSLCDCELVVRVFLVWAGAEAVSGFVESGEVVCDGCESELCGDVGQGAGAEGSEVALFFEDSEDRFDECLASAVE